MRAQQAAEGIALPTGEAASSSASEVPSLHGGYEALSNEGASNAKLDLQARGEDLDRIVDALGLAGVESVLDVGCGSGALTRALARRVDAGATVVGMDISPHHVRHASAHSKRAGMNHLRFVVGDIFSTSADDLGGHFDLVLCRYVLMYMIPRGLGEACLMGMARLARPRGRVACLEADVNFGQQQHPVPSPELAKVMKRTVEYYRRHGLIEWRCGLRLFSVMQATSLRDVEVRLVDGRRIQSGLPDELVQHDGADLEALIRPVVQSTPGSRTPASYAAEWRRLLGSPGSYFYTPIFLGVGRVPLAPGLAYG